MYIFHCAAPWFFFGFSVFFETMPLYTRKSWNLIVDQVGLKLLGTFLSSLLPKDIFHHIQSNIFKVIHLFKIINLKDNSLIFIL